MDTLSAASAAKRMPLHLYDCICRTRLLRSPKLLSHDRNTLILTWYRCEVDDGRDHGAQADEDAESEEHDAPGEPGSPGRCRDGRYREAETRESVQKQTCGLAGVVAADTLAPLEQVHCQGESRFPIKRKIFQLAEAL